MPVWSLEWCPTCGARVRSDRMARHVEKAHAGSFARRKASKGLKANNAFAKPQGTLSRQDWFERHLTQGGLCSPK